MALTRWRTQTLLGTSTANWNFTYLDNGNVNFPDNKKYSRSKPTIIRIPPTTLMPIRLTLLFFIILFAKTNSSAPTTIIKTDINGYMSFLLSNSDLLSRVYHTASRKTIPDAKKAGYRRYDDTLPLFLRMALTYIVPVRYCMNRGSANGAPAGGAFLVDIPEDWKPRAKQQPTGLIAYGTSCRRPVLVLYRPPQKNPQTEWSGDVVDGTGLEPVTSCTSSRCSTS